MVLALTQSEGTISGRLHSGRSEGHVSGWGVNEPVSYPVPEGPVTGIVRENQVELAVRTVDSESSRRTFKGSVTASGMAGNGWTAEWGGSTVLPRPLAPSDLTAEVKASTEAIVFDRRDNSYHESGFVLFGRRDAGDWSYLAGIQQANVVSARYDQPCRAIAMCDYVIMAFRIAEVGPVISDPSNTVTVFRP